MFEVGNDFEWISQIYQRPVNLWLCAFTILFLYELPMKWETIISLTCPLHPDGVFLVAIFSNGLKEQIDLEFFVYVGHQDSIAKNVVHIYWQ